MKLEKEIQAAVVAHARKAGVLALKWAIFGNYGTPGVPDYLFFYKGKIEMIEFKGAGKKPTPLQKNMHLLLVVHGFYVNIVDNVDDGVKIIKSMVESADQG